MNTDTLTTNVQPDVDDLMEIEEIICAHRPLPPAAIEACECGAYYESACECGATTAEYAILTLAAVAFAGVLAVVIKSGPVQSLIQGIIEQALSS
jgi:hypothetical protein